VWGCFTKKGMGNLVLIDGILTGDKYKIILEENLFQSANKMGLGSNFIFQLDNDSKHRSSVVTKWLDKKRVKRLD
jgi:hypothetical protein